MLIDSRRQALFFYVTFGFWFSAYYVNPRPCKYKIQIQQLFLLRPLQLQKSANTCFTAVGRLK